MKKPRRYITNARETLRKSPVIDNIYIDVKYVKSAFGIAYLGVSEVVNEYLLAGGLTRKDLPKKVEEYEKALRKYGGVRNGKLLRQFSVLYDELHIAGYYRGLLRNANLVKDALKNAEDFIGKLK